MRELIHAINENRSGSANPADPNKPIDPSKPSGSWDRSQCPGCPTNLRAAQPPPAEICTGSQCKPEWKGAQTTIQRWYADPFMDNDGQDNTIRTVFTHDHFGPSTHQQAGLYAGLLDRAERLDVEDERGRRADGHEDGRRADELAGQNPHDEPRGQLPRIRTGVPGLHVGVLALAE